MKQLWNSLNKFYLANVAIVSLVLFSITFMFLIQFKVEGLQDEIAKTENDIVAYEDKIKLLEVEWVYLTRPERLRDLANLYLKDNSYTLASQIKNSDKLEKYYLANEQKYVAQEVAFIEQNSAEEKVSF
ncbi:MAG: hypothetical protein FJ368_03565 [Pelagibacterales bacterium]|nr:hypothetical protein [Pelagibacterales bacterium]